MKLLLDTCALIWLTSEPDQLSADAAKAINEPAVVLCVSHASLWEIILKNSVGKLFLPDEPRAWWTKQIARWGLIELPISTEALFASTELPKHHKDPFDRVILAQAQLENCHLISADSEFRAYGIPLIW